MYLHSTTFIKDRINISIIISLFALMTMTSLVEANSIDPDKPTVLITGSNRGIGFGFVNHYAIEGWNVIATTRSPQRAGDLQTLAKEYKNVVIEQLDVTDYDGIKKLSNDYKDVSIDLLINNAGILGKMETQYLGSYDYSNFERVMAINVFGPMKMAEAFAEQVAKSDQKKIVTITSAAAIVSNASRFTGMQFYSISKAAVNKAMRGVQAELNPKGIIVALISPGGVQTDMLKQAFGEQASNFGAQTVESSVAAMTKVIEGLDKSYDGSHLNFDGRVMPW